MGRHKTLQSTAHELHTPHPFHPWSRHRENPFLVWGEDQCCSQRCCCSLVTASLMPATPDGHQLLTEHTVCPTCCCRFSPERCESPIPGDTPSYFHEFISYFHEFIKFWFLTCHQPIAGGLRVFVLERGFAGPLCACCSSCWRCRHPVTKPPTNAPRLPLAYQHSMKMQFKQEKGKGKSRNS